MMASRTIAPFAILWATNDSIKGSSQGRHNALTPLAGVRRAMHRR